MSRESFRCGLFTEVKSRRPWFVLGWVTVWEDRTLYMHIVAT
jgi:hypothetical protein